MNCILHCAILQWHWHFCDFIKGWQNLAFSAAPPSIPYNISLCLWKTKDGTLIGSRIRSIEARVISDHIIRPLKVMLAAKTLPNPTSKRLDSMYKLSYSVILETKDPTRSRKVTYKTANYCWMPTDKSLSNRFAKNKTTISVVRVTFSQSLIDRAQVQIDGIM